MPSSTNRPFLIILGLAAGMTLSSPELLRFMMSQSPPAKLWVQVISRTRRRPRVSHLAHRPAGTDSKVFVQLRGTRGGGTETSSGDIELHSHAASCHALDPKAQVGVAGVKPCFRIVMLLARR